jgi:hypothetical protein
VLVLSLAKAIVACLEHVARIIKPGKPLTSHVPIASPWESRLFWTPEGNLPDAQKRKEGTLPPQEKASCAESTEKFEARNDFDPLDTPIQ